MIKLRHCLLISVFVFLFSSCSLKDKNNVVSIESNSVEIEEQKVIDSPTPTPAPSATPTPELTSQEKADLLANIGNKYIKNGGSCEVNRDEFTDSTSLSIPNPSSLEMITGDNSEVVTIYSCVYQDTEEYSKGEIMLMVSYTYDGDIVNPTEIYFKTDDKKFVLTNLYQASYDIGLGYVQEVYGCSFNNMKEISSLQEILKEPGNVRVRFSGDSTIDFSLDDGIKRSLLDSINLYKEFMEDVNK